MTQSVHCTYDTSNSRISKTVKDGSGNVTLAEFYVYDGSNLLLVLDGSGSVKSRYLNGPSENQVLAEETDIVANGAGETRWALADHEGSVRDVVGNSGTVLDHIEYDSFGNVLSQTNSANAMRLGYTGQQYDPETGLYYDHARYYDPASGRFLSTDPSGFTAGDANLYRYVGNSPLNNTDLSGLCADSSTGSPKIGQIVQAPDGQWSVYRGQTAGGNDIYELPPNDAAYFQQVQNQNLSLADAYNGLQESVGQLANDEQQVTRFEAGLLMQKINNGAGDASDLRQLQSDLQALKWPQGQINDYFNNLNQQNQKANADRQAAITLQDQTDQGVQIAKGYSWDAPKAIITGLVKSAADPIGSTVNQINAIAGFIGDPVGTVQSIGNNLQQTWQSPEGKGQILGMIGWSLVLGKAIPGGGTAGDAAAGDAGVTEPIEHFGGAAMPGESVPLPPGMTSGPVEYGGGAADNLSSFTAKQQSAMDKIGNILDDHFVPGPRGDIAGTVSEMVGNYISKPSGGFWDHLNEMNNSIRGLERAATTLQTTGDVIAIAIKESALQAIKSANDAIRAIGI